MEHKIQITICDDLYRRVESVGAQMLALPIMSGMGELKKAQIYRTIFVNGLRATEAELARMVAASEEADFEKRQAQSS